MAQANGGAGINAPAPVGVGVECQGFAQLEKKGNPQRKAKSFAQYNGDSQAWIDACDPARDVSAQTNPSGAGTWEAGQNGSFPGVGVECQGFAQRHSSH